jgi:hypothetical protein
MTFDRVALITTTINVPTMLELYANDWSVNEELTGKLDIIVAGDVQTPTEVENFVSSLGGTYIPVDSMLAKRWRTDKHVGHRSIQRRNIALLHAIASGADLIITVDDDNTPSRQYFDTLLGEFDRSAQRVFTAKSGWFNPCSMLYPKTIARGFPIVERHPHETSGVYSWRDDVRIGVVNGLTTGDPDIDAIERLVNWPKVDRLVSEVNIALAADTWAPFNTQNTAFVRELAPLMQCLVGVGRYDDIFMSYIARVIMDATGWHVSYGEPSTHSVRNDHDIVIDLEKEMYGYKRQAALIEALRDFRDQWMQEASGNKAHMLATLYEHISPLLREETIAANKAWISDVETAMKEGEHD